MLRVMSRFGALVLGLVVVSAGACSGTAPGPDTACFVVAEETTTFCECAKSTEHSDLKACPTSTHDSDTFCFLDSHAQRCECGGVGCWGGERDCTCGFGYTQQMTTACNVTAQRLHCCRPEYAKSWSYFCDCSDLACSEGELEVASCDNIANVTDLVSGHEVRTVDNCSVNVLRLISGDSGSSGDPPGGGGGTNTSGGTGGGGTGSQCTNVGFCGPTLDRCDCGFSCINYGPATYTCALSCTTDADCIGRKHPVNGKAFTKCPAPYETDAVMYQTYCE